MENLLSIYQTEDHVNIRIAKSDLVFLAETHNESPVEVVKQKEFIDSVVWMLRNYEDQNSQEIGLTILQDVIDRCIMQVVESGEDCVKEKDWRK